MPAWQIVLLVTGCVGAFSGLMVLMASLDKSSSGSSRSQEREEPTVPSHLKPRTAIDAWVMAQTFVKRGLKAPSTADFGSVFSGDHQKPDEVCKRNAGSDETWTCSGWVDAQNAFGAQVRNHFVITLTYQRDSAETWRSDGPIFADQ